MGQLATESLAADPALESCFFDDFHGLDVVAKWSDVSGDTGAAPSLATDGDDAVILTTGATNNNEAYLVSNRAFDLSVGKQLVAETMVKYTESATDDANLLFGLMSAAAADSLLDDGGGPAANYSGAVFYKVDGGTKWYVESSIAGAQTTNETERLAAGITGWQLLRIQIDPVSASEAEVTFHIGQEGGSFYRQCVDANGMPIKHTIVTSSFAAAKVILGVKAGSASSETPRFDYVRVHQAK